jgi:hypothetical protein
VGGGLLLGSGEKPGGTLSGAAVVRAGNNGLAAGAGATGPRLRRMAERSLRPVASLSDSGARGELAEGFERALTMSRAPAMTRSTDEARGMVTFFGNHCRVSQMRSRLVSQIQVR